MNKDMMLNNITMNMYELYRYEDEIFQLKQARAAIMALAFNEGASHKEISKSAGLSPSRVKHIILDYKKSHGK